LLHEHASFDFLQAVLFAGQLTRKLRSQGRVPSRGAPELSIEGAEENEVSDQKLEEIRMRELLLSQMQVRILARITGRCLPVYGWLLFSCTKTFPALEPCQLVAALVPVFHVGLLGKK
jgi:hypothetical protein